MTAGHQKAVQGGQADKLGPGNGGFVTTMACDGDGLHNSEGSVCGALQQQLTHGGLGMATGCKRIPCSNAIATSSGKARGTLPLTPLHIAGDKNKMTGIL